MCVCTLVLSVLRGKNRNSLRAPGDARMWRTQLPNQEIASLVAPKNMKRHDKSTCGYAIQLPRLLFFQPSTHMSRFKNRATSQPVLPRRSDDRLGSCRAWPPPRTRRPRLGPGVSRNQLYYYTRKFVSTTNDDNGKKENSKGEDHRTYTRGVDPSFYPQRGDSTPETSQPFRSPSSQ